MAVTGFWPVKSRLKEVIDYAENPDKTIEQKYLDADLYATLQYAENDSKTDEKLYVSGINCSKNFAYSQMIAVKKNLVKEVQILLITDFRVFPRVKLLPKSVTKSALKLQEKCGVTNFRLWLQHILINNITCITIS